MSEQLQRSIARISSRKELVQGAGFLIEGRRVLTCAHVVAAALSFPDTSADPPSDEVLLDFPFIAPGMLAPARVIGWWPVQAPALTVAQEGEDVAVLELMMDPPEGCRPVRLVSANDLWGHHFRTYGFPAASDRGVWATGVTRAEQSGGWLQIEDEKNTGYFVEPGFSGAPVWDEQIAGVIGMVVAADRRPDVRAAFIQSTETLLRAWPPLGRQTIPPCPYRSLNPFREEDAPYFYGRDVYTDQLMAELQHKALLCVFGPSGCGKSSVVFAGLLPRLRGDNRWIITSFCPGSDPFGALAAALVPLLEPQMSETDRLQEKPKLAIGLKSGEIALADVIDRIVAKHSSARNFLLVVDQFEELYALSPSRDVHRKFTDVVLAGLRGVVHDDIAPLVVVVTCRGDFIDQVLSYRPTSDALQEASRILLGPMRQEELRRAIVEPAKRLGVSLEDGLTERILEAVNDEPGDLPLVEFALTSLWARQVDRELKHDAYDEIGGVKRALSNYAEDVYSRLGEADKLRAQRIFVQLVQPNEQTGDTRRVAGRAEIGEENWDLVTQLADSRLVVISGRQEDTVELVHEALIHEWRTLYDWVQSDRKFRVWQEELRRSQRRWKARNEDDGLLLRGVLLIEAANWLEQRGVDLSDAEREFISVSESRFQEEVEEERAQQRRELEQTRQIAFIEGKQEAAKREVSKLESPQRFQRAALAAIVVVIVTLLAAGLRALPIFQSAELSSYDSLLAQTRPPMPTPIVVVGIDQTSIDALSKDGKTISPGVMARAVQALSKAHPKAIGIYYPYYGPTGGQDVLARAIRKRHVVLAERIDSKIASNRARGTLHVESPGSSLIQASAGLGVSNVVADLHGEVLAVDLMQEGISGPLPAFALQLAAVYRHASVETVLHGLPTHMFISYVAGENLGRKSQREFATYQFEPLATGQLLQWQLNAEYAKKIVLIIPEIQAPDDSHNTPLGLMDDGMIQANALATILNNNPVRPAGDLANFAVILLLIALVTVMALYLPIGLSVVGVLLMGAAYALIVRVFFMNGHLWFDVVLPETIIFLTLAGVIGVRYLQAELQRRRFQRIFGEYVKPDMIQGLIDAPEGETALAGAQRSVTLLVVSIRNFAALSKRIEAQQVVELLDIYLADMTNCVQRSEGTISKYVGDQLLAMWNAPLKQPGHSVLAATTALDMIGHMELVNQQLAARDLPPITFGIGVSTGDAVIGRMGTQFRKQYDVVGDVVMITEQLCAHAHGGEVLVGQSTWESVGAQLDVEEIEPLMLGDDGAELRTFRLISVHPPMARAQRAVAETV